MKGHYVGYVAGHDPVHGFLQHVFTERVGVHESRPAFRAFRLSGSNEVYGYEERSSGAKIICKFYGPRFGWDRDKASWLASQEYHHLKTLRGYHLVGSPHHVVRPLAMSRELGSALAVEYYGGEEFSQAISRATCHRDDSHLYWRLKALAYFLATQHNRTANGYGVDFGADASYFTDLVQRLQHRHRIGQWDADEILWLGELWRDRPRMWQDQQVWLHGDATPANFIFGQGMDVAAIDLERMKRGDRMFDVGRVTGELQHAFMAAGDRWRAESFIGHFLWEYSCHFPDRHDTFASITARNPYYMALNLMRIAANGYLSGDYGDRLVRQAKRLLQAS